MRQVLRSNYFVGEDPSVASVGLIPLSTGIWRFGVSGCMLHVRFILGCWIVPDGFSDRSMCDSEFIGFASELLSDVNILSVTRIFVLLLPRLRRGYNSVIPPGLKTRLYPSMFGRKDC